MQQMHLNEIDERNKITNKRQIQEYTPFRRIYTQEREREKLREIENEREKKKKIIKCTQKTYIKYIQ